jgi:glycosyltransferase involved in cell wall biosynthesis
MIEAATHRLPSRDQKDREQVIRVAHVAEFSETSASGVDRTVAGLVSHLDPYGVEPEVWHVSSNHVSVMQRWVGSVRVIDLPAYSRGRSALLGLPAATRHFIAERRNRIDVLHLHSVFIPDNVWVARIARRPYVLTPHGGYSPRVLAGHNRVAKMVWMRMREQSYVRRASLVHAVSPGELTELRATFGSRPLAFVPNAIDVPDEPVAPDARMLGPRKRIVFLGRLDIAHKGLDVLLEGYARYVQSQPEDDTELTLAGPDFRSNRTRLEALAASLLPDQKVRFEGPVFGGEKEELLRSAYVFVHTSRWEGMPYAVLEALATGCPVLLTSATNLGEFVEDFGAGVVVKGTARGVAEGLGRLLEMPAEPYGAMCSAARRLASERFTWPTVAEQMSAAYRTILQ